MISKNKRVIYLGLSPSAVQPMFWFSLLANEIAGNFISSSGCGPDCCKVDFLIPNFIVKYQQINVNYDATMPVNAVKLYSCQISIQSQILFSSELSNLLCEVGGRKNTHI